MSDINNTQAAIEAGKQIGSAESRIVELGGIPVAIYPQDMKAAVLQSVLDAQDARAEAPQRLRGTSVHQELPSFIAHVNRHKDVDSVIFADPEKVKLTAIYNYNGPTAKKPDGGYAEAGTTARWSDHRAVYACPLSVQWKLWLMHNEQWFSQELFGTFLDDNFGDLGNPGKTAIDREMAEPAKVLEVARSLVINAKHSFQREINPTTGEGVLHWKKENEARGSTKVPKSFLLGIPVFEGGELYRIEARLRYEVREGAARFCYSLYLPQVILRDAFAKVRKEAQEQTGLVLFAGSPET
jgi:uncharacterized protein YfdQ (DUF2303 family)